VISDAGRYARARACADGLNCRTIPGMDRRRFLLTSVAGALAAPRPAEAQQSPSTARAFTPTVGMVTFTPAFHDSFVSALRQLGYEEGRNIVIDWRRSPTGEQPDLEDLIRRKPDCLLLAGATFVAHARTLNTSIPIVAIDLETDPLASGIVTSLAHPGGNLTGIFLDHPELAGKEIQLLRELLPRMKRLAVLWDERVDDAQLRAARAAAQLAGISLVTLGARTVQDLDGVIPRAVRARSQALLVLTGPMFTPNRAKLVESAMRHHLPMASVFPILAEAGGVLGYGPDLPDLYRQAAKYVDRVLKGARPADLPVERPSKFLLVINLKTAKALGLTIPPSLLARADQVIE